MNPNRKPGESRIPIPAERLNELQGVGALFRFLQTYPGLKALPVGIENEILRGALDVHIHANPCTLLLRGQDVTDIAIDASRAGMVAVCHKDHHHSTVGTAMMAQRHIDYLFGKGEIPTRVACYGGVPSTFTLDPKYIEAALALPSFKMLWLNSVNGEVLIDGNGRVRPEAVAWIELAKEHRPEPEQEVRRDRRVHRPHARGRKDCGDRGPLRPRPSAGPLHAARDPQDDRRRDLCRDLRIPDAA